MDYEDKTTEDDMKSEDTLLWELALARMNIKDLEEELDLVCEQRDDLADDCLEHERFLKFTCASLWTCLFVEIYVRFIVIIP